MRKHLSALLVSLAILVSPAIAHQKSHYHRTVSIHKTIHTKVLNRGYFHRLQKTSLRGVASWYGWSWEGGATRYGPLRNNALTAAILGGADLPLGGYVRVTNLTNGRSVVVRLTDVGSGGRGIVYHGEYLRRVVDLTYAARRAIGMGDGMAPVEVTVL